MIRRFETRSGARCRRIGAVPVGAILAVCVLLAGCGSGGASPETVARDAHAKSCDKSGFVITSAQGDKTEIYDCRFSKGVEKCITFSKGAAVNATLRAAVRFASEAGTQRPNCLDHPGSDEVRVFFRTSATPSQERYADDQLRNEPCIEKLAFISKARALKIMRKQFPALFQKGQPLADAPNPLPDSLRLTATKPSCVATIGGHVDADRWPGVQSVKWRAS